MTTVERTKEQWVFDIETRGFLDNLKNPSDLFIITAEEINTGEVVAVRLDECEPFARRLYKADRLIGHNIFTFDLPALQATLGWWDRLEDPRDFDTMIATRLIWSNLFDEDITRRKGNPDYLPGNLMGSHSLKAWGLRLGVMKDDYSGGFEEYNDEMFEYAKQDVVVTKALWDLIVSKNYPQAALDLEQSVARLMARQERTGFCFDVHSAEELLRDLMAEQAEIHVRLQAAFPPWEIKTPFTPKVNNSKRGYVKGVETFKVKEVVFNPSSRDHIANRLQVLHGWKPKVFTDGGKPKVDETILESLPYPEAHLLARNFMLDKRIGQLATGPQAWLKKQKEGKIHGRVITNGAVTGRATHSHPNVAQVPSSRAPFGERCRSLFQAPRGRVLVGSDASGLELRCLAHFLHMAGDPSYAEEVVNGDIHTKTQEAAGLPTRDQAKTFSYALLYGAGNGKIGSIIGKGADEGKAIKARYFENIPALEVLIDSCQTKAKQRGYLKGLDGRQLHCRSPHSALNLLLQSAGALVCKQWIIECDRLFQDRGFDVQWHGWVHDEIVVSCPPDEAEAIGMACQDAMRATQSHFQFRCQLDVDHHVGPSWAEVH
jgi:DNA polymerase I-like protein with 3'-5' exonuclease and polymerase domains